jgi:DNA polymerase theta
MTICQNTELLAKWLHANYHISRYRPVPIEEYLVYDNSIYPAANAKDCVRTITRQSSVEVSQRSTAAHGTIDESIYRELENPVVNAIVSLALETAGSGYGALVFCSSRQACQSNAELISDAMPDENVDAHTLDCRMDLIASLQSLPCGLDPVFEKTIIKGVAFHRECLQYVCDFDYII